MGKYKNKVVINQRGASIDINNGTDDESIKISQRSGSNIGINNVVNSELATNNKQVNVISDDFKTVLGESTEFVGRTKNIRSGEDVYDMSGFNTQDELDAMEEWKELYRPVANLNSQFKIKRGGFSYPNGVETEKKGDRLPNPVIGSRVFTVNNAFSGYDSGVAVRYSNKDEVASYLKVPDRGKTEPAKDWEITNIDVKNSAGNTGSQAPGVMEFGEMASAATENGSWDLNAEAQSIVAAISDVREDLLPVEQRMGNGGDRVLFTKMNKTEQVGGAFNDYPSIRIDEKGRSQPLELLVGNTGAFKNHDYVPHVEEIDNSSNFPGGEDSKTIGNRLMRKVGSGGIDIKTLGCVEIGGATLKGGFKKINLNASHGLHIGSESNIEIQSLKSITLRTNRQVYVESSFGVKNNVIVGGGLFVEGETYVNHITAPVEVQQTEDVTILGQFATDFDRRLLIAECEIGGAFYPVYALAKKDIIINYPHSHHFNNIPLRLVDSNGRVRVKAQLENINKHNTISQSLPQRHEKRNVEV